MFGLIKQPDDFGTFFLAVFIINLALYLGYYVFKKVNARGIIIVIVEALISFSFV